MMKSSSDQTPWDSDVVVIGSGIVAGALATVLARSGARVVVLRSGTDSALPPGELVIPYASMMLRLLARRYDIPELGWLGATGAVQQRISPGSGAKQGFGFLYHRPGRQPDPNEANENVTPKMAGEESHLLVDEVAEWFARTASRYGAQVHLGAPVEDVHIGTDAATVRTDDGRSWRTRFVVDASGPDSPIARSLGVVEEPTRLRHHSRTLYTRMAGVALPRDLVTPVDGTASPRQRYRATQHHVFDGGWMWIIPFRSDASVPHPVTSVGLCLDPRVHPDPGTGPEREFARFLSTFPGIAPAFAAARPVGAWTASGRLQHSVTRTVGDRWCLISRAAGYVDPLYGLDLSNGLVSVYALVPRLLDALRADDFTRERFEDMERLEQGMLDFTDDLVANSYTAFREYELWNSWFRVWILQTRLSIFGMQRAYGVYRTTGDLRFADQLERLAAHGSIPDHPALRELFARASKQLRTVADGQRECTDAAKSLWAMFDQAERSHLLPVQFGLSNPAYRGVQGNSPRRAGLLRWAKREAPPEIGGMFREGMRHAVRTSLVPRERVVRWTRSGLTPRAR